LTWSSRTTAVTAALLTGGARVSLSAQTPAPAIDTIIVVNRNVFDLQDPDAPGFLARLANRLHVPTRTGVIRRTLLLNPGDRYDSARVAESERALRGLHVFSRVRFDTTRLDGRLALRVATTDGWSTKPQLGYSSSGGSVSWLVGLVEDNLLGTATSLTAVYNDTPDRSIFSLGYVNPYFFARRARLSAEYKGKSDGRRGQWLAGVPFYETAAPRALLTDGQAASERILRFRNGSPLDTLERRGLRVGVTTGLAVHATTRGYTRLWLAGAWRRDNFAREDSTRSPTFVFPDSAFGTVGAGIDLGHVRFQVLERFNSYARREDVDLSQLFHLGLWAAPRAWGYGPASAGVGVELRGQLSALWPGGFVVLRAGANGVFTAGVPDSGRVSGGLTVASQNLPKQTLVLHLEGAGLRRPSAGEEFDLLTSQSGPRVFAIHQFTGTRMVWLAVEDRVLLADELWGIAGVGVAPFFDYGGAWYAGDPSRVGSDVGLALRFGPTRAVRGDVAEFAVGYRFGEGFSGSRWGFAIRKGVTY